MNQYKSIVDICLFTVDTGQRGEDDCSNKFIAAIRLVTLCHGEKMVVDPCELYSREGLNLEHDTKSTTGASPVVGVSPSAGYEINDCRWGPLSVQHCSALKGSHRPWKLAEELPWGDRNCSAGVLTLTALRYEVASEVLLRRS